MPWLEPGGTGDCEARRNDEPGEVGTDCRAVQRALELPPDERAEFLRQQCGDDESVRAEVASLVEAHGEAEGFLDRPAPGASGDVARLARGSRLGAFEILERLGAGGMGEVYRARDTRLDRLVASRCCRLILPTTRAAASASSARRSIISKLTHPHICTLYDVGSASCRASRCRSS